MSPAINFAGLLIWPCRFAAFGLCLLSSSPFACFNFLLRPAFYFLTFDFLADGIFELSRFQGNV
jgi:hypothetical protein